MKYTPDHQIYDGNVRVGYVDNGQLYGIDKDGFAEPICNIQHQTEAITKLTEWRNTPGNRAS